METLAWHKKLYIEREYLQCPLALSISSSHQQPTDPRVTHPPHTFPTNSTKDILPHSHPREDPVLPAAFRVLSNDHGSFTVPSSVPHWMPPTLQLSSWNPTQTGDPYIESQEWICPNSRCVTRLVTMLDCMILTTVETTMPWRCHCAGQPRTRGLRKCKDYQEQQLIPFRKLRGDWTLISPPPSIL